MTSHDPIATFASLLHHCISDSEPTRDGRDALAAALVVLLGLGSSLLTSYLLTVLGVV